MTDNMHLRYTNITELLNKAKLTLDGKKPQLVYNRLCDMREKAEKAKLQGDEEMQYIMIKRWFDSIMWLKKTPQYRDNKSSSLVNIHANQINEIRVTLADLQRKLDIRYKQLSKDKMQKDSAIEQMELDADMDIDIYMPPLDGPLRLPETPTKDPLVPDNIELITCVQLYQLIQKDDSRYLIIDIRPESQYNESRILSEKCINIPDSKIVAGVIASHLQKYLHKDKKALDLFKHRGSEYCDVVILLDWNTTAKTLTPNKHLSILWNILKGWDPGRHYKKIAILDGGYHEWIIRYPVFSTNPNVTEPEANTVSNEMLDDIEYPEWLHSDDEDGILKPRETKFSLKHINKYDNTLKHDIGRNKTHLNNIEIESANNIKSIKSSTFTKPSVSQSIEQIPKNNNNNNNNNNLWQYDNNIKSQRERTLNATKQIGIPAKPNIDRSSKPVSLESTSESKKVLKLIKELTEVAKYKEKLEEEILEQESSLHTQYGGKHRSVTEEEYIDGNLKSLYSKLEETQKEYVEIEGHLNKYQKIMDTIHFNSEDHFEKNGLMLDLNGTKIRTKRLVADREKLRERLLPKDGKELSAKENDSNIYKEPLKTDNSSAIKVPNTSLERSYSSPNLLQMVARKAPRVDRSSKPQVSPQNENELISKDNVKVSHVTWANREERMAPVHGNVHPGTTGLKNLGNSCYMNSIIQCLSNTTHLAKYLTDNLYADDLNTHNDSTTRGQVVEEVAQVIKALWGGQYKSISPHDLKSTVGNYKLQFHSYEQQDSHEFLTFLLDWMHNDLKKEYQVPHDMSVAEKAWNKAMGSRKSIISNLFFGQLRSTITCSFCNQSSTTYETFNSLTMSLPDSNRCTLNDCISKFVTGQKVVGWKCPKCQMPREAMKKFDFVKLAPIVVIHLNRFAESGGWLEKRNTAVDFPLTDFDLKPYLVTDSKSATISNIRNYSYSLYAMSNHYGTMEGGHYTAFCKNATQNKWYKYDDQTVTEVSASHVKSQTSSAYLLFYTSFSSNIIQY